MKTGKVIASAANTALAAISSLGGISLPGAALKRYYMSDLFVCNKIKPIGRYTLKDTMMSGFWAGNGFDINVKCGNMGLLQVHCNTNEKVFLAVFIDGIKEPRSNMITADSRFITMKIPKGAHTVRIIRDTQISKEPGKYFYFDKLEFNGKILTPPALNEKYIEIIGDSIACGDGANGKYESGCSWNDPEDHSFVMSFAYKLASALGADYSVVARGGIGLLGDTSGSQESAGKKKIPMQEIYEFTNGFEGLIGGERYSFERKPDFIILELSGNDTTTMEDVWKRKVIDFVERIRELNGSGVPIIWSGRSEVHHATVCEIINENAIKNGGFYACRYVYGGSGAAALKTQTAGHPSDAEQTEIADNLIKYLIDQEVIKMADFETPEVEVNEAAPVAEATETEVAEAQVTEAEIAEELAEEEKPTLIDKALEKATPKNVAIAGGAVATAVAGVLTVLGIKKHKKKKAE